MMKPKASGSKGNAVNHVAVQFDLNRQPQTSDYTTGGRERLLDMSVAGHGQFLHFNNVVRRVEGVLQRRATWVLIDQAIVSAGNFLTGNLLGRTLPQTEYGIFGLLLETMLYLNSLQAALVIYPLTIRGATAEAKSLGRLATAASVFTLLMLPLLGLATTFAMSAMNARSLTVAAIAAMVLWQLQETLRRGLIAELRMRDAVWSDSVRYIGQVACVFILAWIGRLTLQSALVVMGIAAAGSIGVQAFQIGMKSVARHDLVQMARDFWQLGRWMVLSNAGSLVTTLGYWWTLRWTHGLEACGVFNAIVQMFRLANPVTVGMTGLITPAVARAASCEGAYAVRRIAFRYIALGAGLLIPFFLVLAIFPTWSLAIFYRSNSPYVQYGSWLQLFVANFTLVYLASVIGAWLAGLGRSQWNFYVQVFSAIVTLLIGLPMTAIWGVPGVTIGGLITSLAAVVCAGWFIHRAQHQPVSL